MSSEIVHVILSIFGLLMRWQSRFGAFGNFRIFDEVTCKDRSSISSSSLRKPGSFHGLFETNITFPILWCPDVSYKVVVSLLAFEILGAS